MEVFNVLGWDNGFDHEKFYSDSGDKVKFQGITYSPSKESIGLDSNEFDVDNMLLKHNNKDYYVGKEAIRQGASSSGRKFNDQKFKNESEIIKLIAGIELLSETKEDIKINNLIVGLNIGAYKENKEEFEKEYSGKDIYYFVGDEGRNVYIENVECFPQGVASLYDELLDDEGNVFNDALFDSRIGVIDIGGKTVDACVFEDTQIIRDSLVSIDQGTTRAFKKAGDRLGVPADNLEHDYLLGKEETYYKGDAIPLEPVITDEFESLAQEIYDKIQFNWTDEDRLEMIILCGGGAATIKKHLDSLFNEDLSMTNDPQFSNVRGYVKLFKFRN